MNATPRHRAGSSTLNALRVYSVLIEQHEPIPASKVADLAGINDRLARRVLSRLAVLGCAQNVGALNAALWVALDVPR